MKKLEVIYTEHTREMLKTEKELEVFEFYLLDLDLIPEHRDSSIAVIKVKREPASNKTILDKVLEVIADLYENQEYVVKYDKLS